MSPARWRSRVAALVQTFELAASPGSRAVLVGMQSDAVAVSTHTRRLNTITAQLCRGSDRVDFLEPPEQRPRHPHLRSSDGFRSWASALATHLIPQLDAVAAARTAPGSARWRRNRPQDETDRQRALDALKLADPRLDAVFDRVVDLARSAFGTRYAALVLIDLDKEWVRASAGFELDEFRRSESFCAVTIRHAQPLVVPDARNDFHFSDYPSVEAGTVRFYAGYPIESPDGLRIGALCVFDPEPRAKDDTDTSYLQSLVHMIQGEMGRPW